MILRIVNYELLETTSQFFSGVVSLFSNVTPDNHQGPSNQVIERTCIPLPDAFVVEGASYYLVARSFFFTV